MNKLTLIPSVLATCILVSCGGSSSGKVNFTTQIKPLLAQRCVSCHNDETFAGNLILQNRKMAFQPVTSGPVIVPGDASKSALYISLTRPDTDHKAMPAVGHRIDPKEVDLFKRWIEQGAEWPEGEAGVISPPKHPRGES